MTVILALLASGATLTWGSTRYDPRLRFRTLSTPRFDIHFHQGEDDVARRLAAFVDDAAAEVDRAVGAAVGRVQIILVDQHDLSNGWATPVPYNTIEISAAAPPVESSIGNTDDWLRLVFIHEYTHIAHLSRAGGWIGGMRRGFGRLPLLFPNLYQPIWGIEGLATWSESGLTGQGRVVAGDFRQLMDRASGVGRFEPLDRVNGGNVDWPSGATPYLYGAYFHDYLASKYGADSIRTLVDETSRRVPYLTSRAYKKVFGRSLGGLWTDFAAATSARVGGTPGEEVSAVRLTHHGFTVSGPRYAPDGALFYSASSPHHVSSLMTVAAGAQPRQVAQRYFGNRIGFHRERLVLDEIEVIRGVGLQSDLYAVDPRDGSRQRLTRDARAGDPDVSRNGTVVCTVQSSDRRALATFVIPNGSDTVTPAVISNEPSTDFGSPRWSPDGAMIAAERRQVGGGAQIVLIDPIARSVRVLADLPGHRSGAPAWTPDGRRVLFSSAVGGQPFRIHAVDVATGAVSRLEGTGLSAQSPDVSPDGRSLVFVGYTVDGYDLFSIDLTGARWTTAEGGGAANPAAPSSSQSGVDARPYSTLKTMAPQFWTPTVESDADELVVGAATGSTDALGRHAYGIEAGWSTRARPDWQIAYAYDRWQPTIFAAYADDTDPWRSGEVRVRELEAGMLLRISRMRFSHATLAAVHAERASFDCPNCDEPIDVDRDLTSVRLGWEFTNARAFGYSISAEEGGRVSVTTETTREAFGADGNGFAMTAEGRRYWRLGPRHAVVAVRGAAARSWGDSDVERRFSAAGSGPLGSGLDFGTDAIGLLRGYDDGAFAGTRAFVVNADYRLPLRRIDRGLGTLPFFLRSLHAAVFVDSGNVWNSGSWADVRTTAGGEVSIDTVLGFVLPVTFTVGGACRHGGPDGEQRFVAFGRIGRAF